MSDWIQSKVTQFIEHYGVVPPPWHVYDDEPPYSLFWRMGGGESHIMVWGAWWDEQAYSLEQAFEYLQAWPPPAIWLEWVIDALWDLRPWEQEEAIDYTPYFAQLEQLGFGSQADFQQALDASFDDDADEEE